MRAAYLDNPSIEKGNVTLPRPETGVDGTVLTIPSFYKRVYKLDDIVPVDYYVPGLPAGCRPGQGRPAGRRPRPAAAAWFGRRRCGDGTVRRVPAYQEREEGHALLSALADHGGPGGLSAGAGRAVRRRRDARRLRRPLPVERHPVPRLLRPSARGGRPGREAALGRRIGDRQQRPGRDRCASSTVFPTSRASRTASARRLRCCKGASANDEEDQHRSHHAPRGPRQDRDLPRRRRSRGGLLLPDPRAARLRALRRGTTDRGVASPRHAHLRRVSGEPSHGQREGRGRLLRRRGRPAGGEAAPHVLQRALHPQPHRSLLRPRGARLRARARTPTPPSATCSAWSRRSGSRSAAPSSPRAAKAQEIQRIIGGRSTQDIWCIPGGVAKGLKPDELEQIRPMVADLLEFTQFSLQLFRDVVLANPTYLDIIANGPYTLDVQNMGLVDENNAPGLLRRPGARRGLRGHGALSLRASAYADYVAEHVEPWTYLQVPVPQAARGWKGFAEGHRHVHLLRNAARPAERGRPHGHPQGPGGVRGDVRDARRPSQQDAARPALGAACGDGAERGDAAARTATTPRSPATPTASSRSA